MRAFETIDRVLHGDADVQITAGRTRSSRLRALAVALAWLVVAAPFAGAQDESPADAHDESSADAHDESSADAHDESSADAHDESSADAHDESSADAPDDAPVEGQQSPAPEPLTPSLEHPIDSGVIEQAGAGSDVPYGAAGVLEVGGAAAVSVDAIGVIAVLRPFVGWFLFDGFELTLANQLVIVSRDSDLRLALTGTLEVSAHIPLVVRLWLAIGAAIGYLYNGSEGGIVGAPRLGLDVMIGRSGMLHVSGLAMFASADLAGPPGALDRQTRWQAGGEIAYSALF